MVNPNIKHDNREPLPAKTQETKTGIAPATEHKMRPKSDEVIGLAEDTDDVPGFAKEPTGKANGKSNEAKPAEPALTDKIEGRLRELGIIDAKATEHFSFLTGDDDSKINITLPSSFDPKALPQLLKDYGIQPEIAEKVRVKPEWVQWELTPAAMERALIENGLNKEKAAVVMAKLSKLDELKPEQKAQFIDTFIRNNSLQIPREGMEEAKLKMNGANFVVSHVSGGTNMSVFVASEDVQKLKEGKDPEVKVGGYGARLIVLPASLLKEALDKPLPDEVTARLEAEKEANKPAYERVGDRFDKVFGKIAGVSLNPVQGEDNAISHYEISAPRISPKDLTHLGTFPEGALERVTMVSSGKPYDTWQVPAALVESIVPNAAEMPPQDLSTAFAVKGEHEIRAGMMDANVVKKGDHYAITNIKPGTNPEETFGEKANEITVIPGGDKAVLRVAAADMEAACSGPLPARTR